MVNTDCCWLNTPQRPQNHPWSNCYTNAYVILDPSYGPPWARNCVKLLDALVGNGPESGAGAPNGGNGNNGSNGNNGGAAVKKTKVNKPTGHVITPSKPVKVNTTAQKSSASAAKVTPVQKAEKNKKAAK
ncbi:MAG: hypothetical protein J5594_03405 [Elusimicrobiaceae bacterium]|nr:hypothetical protein [Elusimicrobiaceae bacterium]